MPEDRIDTDAAKDAARGFAEAGSVLLQHMNPRQIFHALCAGAIAFGTQHFGREDVAGWLRILADEIDRPEAKH